MVAVGRRSVGFSRRKRRPARTTALLASPKPRLMACTRRWSRAGPGPGQAVGGTAQGARSAGGAPVHRAWRWKKVRCQAVRVARREISAERRAVLTPSPMATSRGRSGQACGRAVSISPSQA